MYRIGLLIVIGYFVLGAAYAIRTPAWQAPDEPAHANYIAQVASAGCCPIIAPGDWDQTYLNTLIGSGFASGGLDRLAALQYEDHQPPLYYLIGAPIYALTNGSLIALRMLSVVIGAGVVIAAFAFGRQLYPTRPFVALGMAGLVAFIPQHLAMMSAVNNDGLAELIAGITLIGTVNYVKDGRIQPIHLGIMVGIGLLTKVSTIFLLGLVPLAIVLKHMLFTPSSQVESGTGGEVSLQTQRGGEVRRLLPALIAFFIPALILGGVWWIRNLSVYGVPDFLGLAAHDRVVVGQLRTAEYIAQIGVSEYYRRAAETTFNSFWGQFGWMVLPLPTWSYAIIGGLIGLSGVGWLIDVTRRNRATRVDAGERENPPAVWIVLGVGILLVFAQYVYYNAQFVQTQGRYLFPALLPLAVIAVLGWARLRREVALIGGVMLIPLNLYLLWRVIPLLAPG